MKHLRFLRCVEVAQGVEVTRIVLLVLIGLAVFLYAVGHLSDALRKVAGERLKHWLERHTRSVLGGVLVGTLVTMLLDSSSAVIILTIVLVNSGLMTFRNALGVVMGANIGTTFSSQIIAFDIGEWSAVPMLVGLVLLHAGRSERWRGLGDVVFSFGLLFAGLFMMGSAVAPLKGRPEFATWMQGLEDPLKGAVTGGLLTLVIQSSSATVAMAITLANKGMLSIAAGMAVMLGAELGTCSDTLLATLRTDRQALKVGLFHLGFSLITIVFGLLFIHPLTGLTSWLSGGAGEGRTIANGHMLFNILGVLAFLPFTCRIAAAMDRWLPDRMTHVVV